jgi:hypothetical protein
MERIKKLISIKNPILVGSAADPKIKYSADYDYVEEVPYSILNIRKFQKNVNELEGIQDIKIGEISEWNLLRDVQIKTKVVGYSQVKEIDNLDLLLAQEIISKDEYNEARKLLKKHLSPVDFIQAQKELRFGLLRWTPEEVHDGAKQLRNGQIITLEAACKSAGITKIDVIAPIPKYTEFSNIIFWKPYANKIDEENIKKDILVYLEDQNYLKVLKRMYSYNKEKGQKIIPILNSDLGKLYVIVSDLKTLQESGVSKSKVKLALNEIRNELLSINIKGIKKYKRLSFKSISRLEAVLQNETRLKMKKAGLLPIPKYYLP